MDSLRDYIIVPFLVTTGAFAEHSLTWAAIGYTLIVSTMAVRHFRVPVDRSVGVFVIIKTPHPL